MQHPLKWHFWKFLWTVQYNTEHWHGWWAQRLGVAETACQNRSPLYWFRDVFELTEYVHIDYCQHDSVTAQRLGNFKSASFGKQVWPVWSFLSWSFHTRFSHTWCYIKGYCFGNKMYISELFTDVGYFHMADFKKHRETYCAKCRCTVCTISRQQWFQCHHAAVLLVCRHIDFCSHAYALCRITFTHEHPVKYTAKLLM